MSKLTNCKACNKEIATGVNKCPHCGKDQRNFIMKHKVITGILILMVLGIVGNATRNKNETSTAVTTNKVSVSSSSTSSFSSSDSIGSSSSSDSTSASSKSTPAKEVVKEFYAVNEPVKLEDAIVTVIKVEKSIGEKYYKPKDGMEFVIVTVSIKNGGTGEVDYNPYDFKMQNSKGQITDESFTMINDGNRLSSGSLAGGGEIIGSMVFEQPKADTALILKYKVNMFIDQEIKIKLN